MNQPDPAQPAPVSRDTRPFKITWREGAYYVSIPNYEGGWVAPVPEPVAEASDDTDQEVT